VTGAGLVIKDLPLRVSNFRATMSLAEYLQREGTGGHRQHRYAAPDAAAAQAAGRRTAAS